MRTCYCGQKFEPRSHNQKYCSYECYYEPMLERAIEWHRKNKVKQYPKQGKCSVCGRKMTMNRPQHKYCNREKCQAEKRKVGHCRAKGTTRRADPRRIQNDQRHERLH